MKPVLILIVEDELIIARHMQIVLENKGYKICVIARCGEQALEIIKKDKPDLVLMDIHLKGNIDGITTARTINRLYSLPVIFVTEQDNEDVFRTANETHPKNYLTKPFTDNALFRAVELAIQQPETQQANPSFDQIESKVNDAVFIITSENVSKKLPFKDILYIESNTVYSKIYFKEEGNTKDSYYNISYSSNVVVAKLGYPELVKVHRSFHVNIQRIEGIKNAEISLQGTSTTIPVGQEFKKSFNKKLIFLKHNPVQK